MIYRLALVNPITNIKQDLQDVIIKNAIAYDKKGNQVGKIVYGNQISGVPKNVDYPKNILNLKGKAKVIDFFEFGYENIQRVGAIVEFTPDEEKILTVKKEIIFSINPESELKLKVICKEKNKQVIIKNTVNSLELYYNNEKVAQKDISKFKDSIPDCEGYISSIENNFIKVLVNYNEYTYSNCNEKGYLNELNELQKEIYDYLKDKIELFFIKQVFKTHRKYEVGKDLIPRPRKLYICNDKDDIKIAIISILKGKHLLIEGPKGTGKNIFTETIAWIFQRPLYKESVSIDTDEYKLIGSPSLVNVENKDGTTSTITSYNEHSLITAMKNGYVYMLDEINMANAGLLSCFNSVTDDSKSYFLPSGEKVISDKNFFVIATMNKGYAGTQEINEALVDRFVNFRFKYKNKIIPILEESRGDKIDSSLAKKIESIYSEMLNIVKDNQLNENCITIRGFIDLIDLVEDGISFEKAFEIAIINRTDEFFMEKLKVVVNAFK